MEQARLLWLYAPIKDRTGFFDGRRTIIPDEGIYTESIRAELRANGDLDGLPGGASAKQIANHFSRYGGRVHGVVLLRPLFATTPGHILTVPLRALSDFYLNTRHGAAPLLALTVLDAVPLLQPCTVAAVGRGNARTSLFFNMTGFSFDRVYASLSADGASSMRAVIDGWVQSRGLDPEALHTGPGMRFETVMCLPYPHIRLLLTGRWGQTGMPIRVGRTAGSGLHLVRDFLAGADLDAAGGVHDRDEGPDEDVDAAMTPARLQRLADYLRARAATDDSRELRAEIAWLQRRRDTMVLDAVRLSRKCFDMEHLCQCVLMSALLKTAALLRETVESALAVSIRDPAFLEQALATVAGALCRARRRSNDTASRCSWASWAHPN